MKTQHCVPQCGRVSRARESALYSAACWACLAFLRLASRSSGGRARPVSCAKVFWKGLSAGLPGAASLLPTARRASWGGEDASLAAAAFLGLAAAAAAEAGAAA